MNFAATAIPEPQLVTRPSSFALRWPTPPYASYGTPENGADNPAAAGLDCLVEGSNGQMRPCRLMGLDLPAGLAHIQVPPSRTIMPLRFDMFRRISLTQPLAPLPHTQGNASPEVGSHPSSADDLLRHRPRLPYRLELSDGSVQTGLTIGHLESAVGVFLFVPLDAQDRVQRVFCRPTCCAACRSGKASARCWSSNT